MVAVDLRPAPLPRRRRHPQRRARARGARSPARTRSSPARRSSATASWTSAFARSLADAVGADRVIAAVDSRGGHVVIHGWKTVLPITAVDAVRALEPYCGEFLYTHVDTEGLMQGTDMDAIMAVRARHHAARDRRRRHHHVGRDRPPRRRRRRRRRRHGDLHGAAAAGSLVAIGGPCNRSTATDPATNHDPATGHVCYVNRRNHYVI